MTKPRSAIYLVAAQIVGAVCLASAADINRGNALTEIVSRTNTQVTKLLDQFSNVKCAELVEQNKFRSDGKVELKEQSTYDYLAIISNRGGELSFNESRVPVREARPEKKNTPMLMSNGFATLFLVFHPLYVDSFRFTITGQAVSYGRALVKIGFEHISGTRSPAALALRGREYPLELSGEAWVDPQSGVITRITASVGDTLQDLGLKSLQSEVVFAPVRFHDASETYWFPAVATVEVETPRQHWRNTHHFTDYKQFSVSTEENITTK